ncbi:MAG: acyl-CoA thioesterase [Chloroflexi bacterium]|nr:acyl-CoA thioesterase [Chloroflexota bacterium]
MITRKERQASPLLDDYPIIYETDVAWGEMDAFQHVNNVVYFRYFESARLKYFERTSMLQEMEETGVGPILHSIGCRFRFPLTYPDRIQVGVRVLTLGEDRLTLHHRVVSERHQRIAAEGEGIVVMYDYRNNRKARLSLTLRSAIAELEGW